jgi:signal transduction histidine kinase
LLVKLGVVLVVPVVSALVLGVLRVQADVALGDSYRDVERVAALRAEFVSVVSAVQRERDEAVRAGGQVQRVAGETDRAVGAMTAVVRENPALGGPATGYNALRRAIDTLPAARRQAGGDGMIAISAYNAVINTVLEFDRSLIGRFPDLDLAAMSLSLAELQGMREQVALQQAIGSATLRDHALPDSGRQQLIETDVRLGDKFADFRAQAPPGLAALYDQVVTDRDVIAFQQMVEAVRTTDPTALPFGRERWDAAAAATVKLMDGLTSRAANALRTDSSALAEAVSNRAGLESVLLLTMVLLAAGIGGGLGRYLLRSVAMLRRTALDVANERLPAAVAAIRTGDAAPPIEPVPLRSTEEFGQLARAFDAVHGQAVRSAAEEATLRSSLANIFTNLSRRSQGLVERQLRLMEQLEQKTDDPEQLENLFKIDHLATRMRRNNENLMVLSGTGLLRRFTEPMPLPDVLRAAISEVEHYQRAVVRSVPDVRIAGYAAGDLIRSISELIENATAFSPPDAQVTVVSRLLQDGSVVVDIIDTGVSMAERDLREANNRITGGGGVDVPISRQMGLFVVGRLTARHGIHVRLIRRAEGGLCASVLVPAGLVNIADPGATASLALPRPRQSGPSTAKEWLRTPAAATSWPSGGVPAPVRPSGVGSWLETATRDSRPVKREKRSPAVSWLTAAKAGERPETSTWLEVAKAQAAAAGTPVVEGEVAAEQTQTLAGVDDKAGADAVVATEAAQGGDGAWQESATEVTAVTEGPAGTSLPEAAFEPGEVVRQLKSFGIVVTRLPDLPDASTPAAILFDDGTAGGGESGFSWLRGQGAAAATATAEPTTATEPEPAEQATPAEPAAKSEPVVVKGPAGLPKRVPKRQLAAQRGGSPPPTAVPRDAARTRGFLSGLQDGIRQRDDREEESGS